jgi:hypothetical protein
MRPQFIAVMAIIVVIFLMLMNGKSAQGIQKRNAITTREYQFDVDMQGYYIYDGENYLGFVPFGTSTVLDAIIIQDNL